MKQMPQHPVARFLHSMNADCAEPDGELLERYIQHQDEGAFTTLMIRYGTMVFNTCLRALGDPHDAEDAFQVTFLVLAHRAVSIRQTTTLAAWLHGVACRTAKNLRRQLAVQRKKEAGIEPREHTEPNMALLWEEVRPVIDQEINRLPDRYRLPVVLCYLEGRTNDEAAGELGCSRGTVAGRLSRARDILRQRLTIKGITLQSAALLSILMEQSASAAVPPPLIPTTAQGVTAPCEKITTLAQKVIQQMTNYGFTKWVGMVAVMCLLVGSICVMANAVAEPLPQPTKPKEPVDKTKAKPQKWKQSFDLKGHDERDDVWAVKFSPDGKIIASASEDKTVILWSVAKRAPLAKMLGHKDEIEGLAFTPDGKQVVTGGWDNLINVWAVPTGQLRMRINRHKDRIWRLVISPDGTTIAAGGRDKQVTFWNVATGQQAGNLPINNTVIGLAYSPDGRYLAVGNGDDKLIILDGKNPTKVKPVSLDAGTNDLRGICFSPDGKWLAASGPKDTVGLLSTKTWKVEKSLAGHKRKILAMDFHPSGKFLATADQDGKLFIWDVAREVKVGTISMDDKIPGLAYSPDGNLLATVTDGLVTVWKKE